MCIRDSNNQSCEGRVHTVKVKFDVLKEILTILRAKLRRGICETVQALIWGEFYPDRYTPADFEKMDVDCPEEFKPASFASIMSTKIVQPSPAKKQKMSPEAFQYWQKMGFIKQIK